MPMGGPDPDPDLIAAASVRLRGLAEQYAVGEGIWTVGLEEDEEKEILIRNLELLHQVDYEGCLVSL